MSNTTHYSLEVKRLADLQRGSRIPGLYVKVKLRNDTVGKTGPIRENEPPTQMATFAFLPVDESDILSVCVTEEPKRSIGCANISIKELLERCIKGEAKLDLLTSSSRGHMTPSSAGTIYLYLKDVGIEKLVNIDVEAARQHIKQIERSANAADSTANTVGSLVRKLDEVIKAGDDISSRIHPFLNLAWQAATVLYKIVSHQFKTDKKLVELVDLMRQAFAFASNANMLVNKAEKLKETISELLELTVDLCTFVAKYTSKGFFARVLKIGSKSRIDSYKERLLFLKDGIDSGVALHGALAVDRVYDEVDIIGLQHRIQALEILLEPLKSDTSGRARCLPNTRTRYLNKIEEWIFSPPKENILWLNGIAGSGKSTIAASITDFCDDKSRLAAFIFFERGKDEHRSVIRTIAYQLAAFEPILATHIIAAAEKLRNISGSSPQRQFEKLLLEPLESSIGVVRGPIVIILDALDECGTAEQRQEILELLKADFRKLPLEFRFFVTSRPENDIVKSLSSQTHIYEIKLDPSSTESHDDVRAYIDNAMRKTIADPIPDGFEFDSMMKILSDAADGLFIWASTPVKMVAGSGDQVEKLEELTTNVRSISSLGNLYSSVLEQSGIPWKEEKSKERFQKILGLIIFGKEPVSDNDIDNVLGLGAGKSRLILQKLQSVLSFESGMPIRLHHASFADYLLSSKSSDEQPWFVDAEAQKQLIIFRCLDVMEQLLHFNMCNLETSFIRNGDIPELEGRITKNIPTQLSYACRFWAEHLRDVPYSPGLERKLRTFAYKYLPYWLEVLSLTKNINNVTGRALMGAVSWFAWNESETLEFLKDAYRLSNIFALPISQSAPHIYLSMLSLLRDESVVSKHFSGTHPTIITHRSGTKPPTSCIKVLDDHERAVNAVAFSPDGRRVVSGSSDCTIRIWDSETWQVIASPFKWHKSSIYAVAFSPDGKHIVSGSYDKTICVWNAESRQVVWARYEVHGEVVYSVAFSPDGTLIVSGSYDRTTCVWDAKSGRIVWNLFAEYGGAVHSVAFSPDGKYIVPACDIGAFSVWNTISGEIGKHPFMFMHKCILSVAFSPNGKSLISGCDDGKILVWDTNTWEFVASLSGGHYQAVTSVAFSPDGKYTVSGSKDCTVCVWDNKTGNVVGLFEGHDRQVYSVAFSPDGKHIISGSGDCTIRIWDVRRGEAVTSMFDEYNARVSSIAFSHSGRRIASGSADGMIQIRDIETTQVVVYQSEGYAEEITSIAFSPDEKHIVSGSDGGNISMWDAETGQIALGPFRRHNGRVYSVAFTQDGRCVVSGSSDGTIRAWDIQGVDTITRLFDGHDNRLQSVKFSTGGQYIAFCYNDGTICVRDAETGKVVADLIDGHKNAACLVAFSPDSKCIVSCSSSDSTLHIWDIETGAVVARPIISGKILSVAFSPDSKYIASGSLDCTVCIWDAKTGYVIAWMPSQHRDAVLSIAFSTDSKRIVSGSSDRSVYVYDVKTRRPIAGRSMWHKNSVHLVAFSPNGEHVVSGSSDGTIVVWDIKTEQAVVGPLKMHNKTWIYSVAILPTRIRVVSGCQDGMVYVWGTESQYIIAGPFKPCGRKVYSATFMPDEKGVRVVSGSNDGTFLVWDVQTIEPETSLQEDFDHCVCTAALSHNGKHIVVGHKDGRIHIKDTDTGELVTGTFEGHDGMVSSVAFSPDGRHIVSGSVDSEIFVWDAETGEIVAGPFEGHNKSVKSVAFSPDGKCVVSGSDDRTIRIWSVETELLDQTSDNLEMTETDISELSDSYFESSWTMSEDGWILGEDGELLTWIPPD